MTTRNRQAEQDWIDSEGALSGMDLARKYKMSPRWGQLRAGVARKRMSDPYAPKPMRPAPGTRKPTSDTRKPVVRMRKDSDAFRRSGILAAVIVGVAAFLMSYSYIRHLATLAGLGWHADLLPLTLDGMLGACTFAIIRRRSLLLAWTGVLIGGVGSIAANLLAVAPELVDLHRVGMILAIFPPVAFAVSLELVISGLRK